CVGLIWSGERTAWALVSCLASRRVLFRSRWLRTPARLLSEPASGVNGTPEVSRPRAVTSSAPLTGYVTVASRECRRSKALVAHSRALGSPAVVGAANPWLTAQQENDDWSRARLKVYDSCKAAPRGGRRLTPTVSCLV